jgi:hypothetical protein
MSKLKVAARLELQKSLLSQIEQETLVYTGRKQISETMCSNYQDKNSSTTINWGIKPFDMYLAKKRGPFFLATKK